MKNSFTILIIFVLIASVKNINAQHIDTLSSIADVHIVTFGGGEGKNSFLKFDISSIPTANVITEVKLRVLVTDVAPMWDGDAGYSRVDDQTWLESDPNDTLWNPINFYDTLIQPLNFAIAPGWTESIDIKTLFGYDYSLANTFFTLMIKDPDDWTMAPGFYPPNDSNDSIMVGNIFNDYIVFAPHEFPVPGSAPQLIVSYTLVPLVTGQSNDSTKCEMEEVEFFVSATGDSLQYQWQKNGVDMPSENDDTLSLSSLSLADAAVYRCIVSNAVAADTTNDITLIVNSLPVVNLGPDTSLCADASITLDAGPGNDSYLWSDASTAQTLFVDSNAYGLGTTIFYVDVTKANCTQRDSIEITFIVCSDISEHTNGFLNIYPNPVNNTLNVEFTNNNTCLMKVLDINGKLIFQKQLCQTISSVDVSQLKKGVYIIQIVSNNGVFTGRFLKE
ncbi:MAG: hypothetical protein C0592_10955 [Marinilabiliales bacterium]|nr:MAG: hypothetical protein C0592_10955 [Marinilabiliales bacterium]